MLRVLFSFALAFFDAGDGSPMSAKAMCKCGMVIPSFDRMLWLIMMSTLVCIAVLQSTLGDYVADVRDWALQFDPMLMISLAHCFALLGFFDSCSNPMHWIMCLVCLHFLNLISDLNPYRSRSLRRPHVAPL